MKNEKYKSEEFIENSLDKYKMNEICKNKMNFLIIVFLIVFLIGSSFVYIKFLFEYKKLNVSFFMIVVEIIIIQYISIYFHELGHIVVSNFFKYRLKLLVMGPLMVMNEEGNLRWKFKITFFLGGGITIIDTNGKISCESDYMKFYNDFKKIMLGGVFFNLIFTIICILGSLIFSTMDIALLVFIINVFMIFSCMLSSGDIYKVMDLDKNFNNLALYLVEEFRISHIMNNFCKQKIYDYVEKFLINREYNSLILSIISIILECNCINGEYETVEIRNFIQWFIYNFENIKFQNIEIANSANNLMKKVILRNYIVNDYITNKNIELMKVRNTIMHKVYMEFKSYRENQILMEKIYNNNKL